MEQAGYSGAVQGLRDVYTQLKSFVLSIPSEDYRAPVDLLSGNSIGKHCRHILEVLEALDKGCTAGPVEYEKRERNPEYEQEAHAFTDRMEQLIHTLTQYPLPHPIELRHEPFPGNIPPERLNSSLGRELLYNMEHMIHHMALIRVAAKSLGLEGQLPVNFGIAYSTLQFTSRS